MMKFHQITGGRPKVVSAVTMPERVVRSGRSAVADRHYDGYQWYEAINGYSLAVDAPVLIEFSDNTFGVTSERHLPDALAAYDVSLDDVSLDTAVF